MFGLQLVACLTDISKIEELDLSIADFTHTLFSRQRAGIEKRALAGHA